MEVKISVASLIEKDGKVLLVKELREGKYVYNQPVGYLEPEEDIVAGAIREAKEETGFDVKPTHLLGVYDWRIPEKLHVVRFCFICEIVGGELGLGVEKDEDVVEVAWFSKEELAKLEDSFRNPLIKMGIKDYFDGKRTSLEALTKVLG